MIAETAGEIPRALLLHASPSHKLTETSQKRPNRQTMGRTQVGVRHTQVSTKQAVRRTATSAAPNKWAAPRGGRGPGMRTRGHAKIGKGPRARRGAPPGENAPSRPAASWSPTGLTRSTIGARGLNFRVRDGTGCASPAMAAGRLGAFCLRGGPTVPWGPHSARKRRSPGTAHGKGMRRSSAD